MSDAHVPCIDLHTLRAPSLAIRINFSRVFGFIHTGICKISAAGYISCTEKVEASRVPGGRIPRWRSGSWIRLMAARGSNFLSILLISLPTGSWEIPVLRAGRTGGGGAS